MRPTLSGGFVVAGVEGGGKSRRRIGDVSVEMAAPPPVREHSHAQDQYHAQQQGAHEARVDRHTGVWGQR